MIRFKFRLAKLQKRAERQTHNAAGEFSNSKRLLEDKEGVKAVLQGEKSRTGRAIPAPGPSVRAAALTGIHTRLQKLGADIHRADADVRAQRLTVEQKRRRYIEAQREQKKFELLRDRRFAEWQAAANREEQKQFDEIAVQRHTLRTAAEIAAHGGRLRRCEPPGSLA
jgi:flagellar export protein FliJ